MAMAMEMEMEMEGFDFSALSAAASQFCSLPGVLSDAATKEFLDRYPLPVLFSALEGGAEVPELESLMILTLEKIFITPYGASALPQALPYARSGLYAKSSSTRRMTCLAISRLLGNGNRGSGAVVNALIVNDLLLPLLTAIADGDADVAIAAAGAVENLAKTSAGFELLFADKGAAAVHLKELVIHGSSLVRIRIFSIVASLFGHSENAASAVKQSGILNILEEELNNTSDVLAQMNALELFYELAVTPNGSKFLLEGGFIHHLTSIMGSNRVDLLVRSQAMMVGARLISPDGSSTSPVPEEDAKRIVQLISTMLNNESSEEEAAIDALGRIGMRIQGAELLLCSSPPIAQHVVEAAFSHKGGGLQVAGIHALASVAGSERTESPLLSERAEASLRDLIFSETERSSKRSPADLLWWLLQQAPETRFAAYRLILPLVARSWCLWEICSNKDLMNFITNHQVERTKEGMEWRHACCVAIDTSLAASSYRVNPSLQEVIEKLQTAVRRGPFLVKRHPEAQPLVITQERF